MFSELAPLHIGDVRGVMRGLFGKDVRFREFGGKGGDWTGLAGR